MEDGYYWAKYLIWGLHASQPQVVLVERGRVYRVGYEQPYSVRLFAWGAPVEPGTLEYVEVNLEEL